MWCIHFISEWWCAELTRYPPTDLTSGSHTHTCKQTGGRHEVRDLCKCHWMLWKNMSLWCFLNYCAIIVFILTASAAWEVDVTLLALQKDFSLDEPARQLLFTDYHPFHFFSLLVGETTCKFSRKIKFNSHSATSGAVCSYFSSSSEKNSCRRVLDTF